MEKYKRDTETGEIEEIMGATIPCLNLSKEDAELSITAKRIMEYEHEVGEDFFDQCPVIANMKVYLGFLLHKYKSFAPEILEFYQ